MTNFEKTRLTAEGIALLAKQGINITFTRAETGCGIYEAGEYIEDMTQLRCKVQDFDISSVSRISDMMSVVNFVISNKELKEDYLLTELGIYAKDDSNNEILYAVCYATIANAQKILSYNGVFVSKIDVSLNIQLSADSTVTIQDGFYASAKELDGLKADVINHKEDKGNPHGVTKNQTGLGNADNIADKDKPISTAQRAAIDEAYANATGYTDKAIANLVGQAPEAMDTIYELAALMSQHQDMVDLLNQAVAQKAAQAELDTHTGNSTIHITASERKTWNTVESKHELVHLRLTPATIKSSTQVHNSLKIPAGQNSGLIDILFNDSSGNLSKLKGVIRACTKSWTTATKSAILFSYCMLHSEDNKVVGISTVIWNLSGEDYTITTNSINSDIDFIGWK